jgi:hypothetical protein
MTRQEDQNTDMGKGNTQKTFENPNGKDSFEKMSLDGSVTKKKLEKHGLVQSD